MNIIETELCGKKKSYENHLFLECVLQDVISYIKNNDLYDEIDMIRIQIEMTEDSIPALAMEKEVLEFFVQYKMPLKIVFGKKVFSEERSTMKIELNITGQFIADIITKMLNKNSDYEYNDRFFRTEDGWGEKHSAWCVESEEHELKDYNYEICCFLKYFQDYEKEVSIIKKEFAGQLLLEHVVSLQTHSRAEIFFGKEAWQMIERIQIDAIDFDIYFTT